LLSTFFGFESTVCSADRPKPKLKKGNPFKHICIDTGKILTHANVRDMPMEAAMKKK
jgi:hypothetical protein